MDSVILVGHLGKEPVLKTTEYGIRAYFNVAINKKYGESKRTAWFSIQCKNRLAEIAGDYLKKGSKVLIRGTVEIGVNKEGAEYIYIRARQLQFLDKKAS